MLMPLVPKNGTLYKIPSSSHPHPKPLHHPRAKSTPTVSDHPKPQANPPTHLPAIPRTRANSLKEKPTYLEHPHHIGSIPPALPHHHGLHVPLSPHRKISVPETITEETGVTVERPSPMFHPIVRRSSSSPQRVRNFSGNSFWPKTPPPLPEETVSDLSDANVSTFKDSSMEPHFTLPTNKSSSNCDSQQICECQQLAVNNRLRLQHHHHHPHLSRSRGFSESRPYFIAKTGNREVDLRRQIATRRLEEFMRDRGDVNHMTAANTQPQWTLTRRRRSLSDGATPLSSVDEIVFEGPIDEPIAEEEKPERMKRFNRITKTIRNILNRLRN